MNRLLFILAFVTHLAVGQSKDVITRIAFGSCSHQDDSVQMWSDIIRQNPDLWIWLGDNIYGDTNDMLLLEGQYNLQKQNADYQKLLATCPVIGTWDDHDYGINDGDKSFPYKKQSKELALDFLGVPKKADVRKHEGIYQSYEYGSGSQVVKVILLDTRYFRDTLIRSEEKGVRYVKNTDGDVLGEAQWKWLAKELKNSKASLHIIGSSIQFIADGHGFEKWGNFPKARKRMLDLLAELKPKNTFFISGDRHIAEISKMTVEGLPYSLYDFTSSGLTHTWDTIWEEVNENRVGQLIIQKNFGLIKINWTGNLPLLEFEIRGYNDKLWQSIPIIMDKQ
ncbi:MAG: alkaline phosphatase D family protein [Bacteroidota bacterium]